MRKLFNIWVIGTVLLYYLGPIEWPGRSEPWVAIFVGTCLLTFNIGFHSVRTPELRRYTDFDVTGLTRSRRFAIIFMLFFAVLSFLYMRAVTGQGLGSILAGNWNFSTVYSDYQLFLEDGVRLGLLDRVFLLLRAILFPIALVLVCMNFMKAPIVLILFFIPMAFFSLARGTDKETVDLVLILGIIAYYHGARKAIKMVAAVAVLPVLYLFVIRKYARFDGAMPDCLPDSVTCFNFSSALAQVSPLLEIGYVMAVHYVTQGYEGLNIAFSLDFNFHYGLGHLPPIRSMVCGILDLSCVSDSFNDRLALVGWDTRYRWSTAYTVLANDLHWAFVPLYTFFIGWSLRLAEQNWTAGRNPSALAVIVLIGVFALYSSANMQLAISLDWAIATVALLYGKALTVRTAAEVRSPAYTV